MLLFHNFTKLNKVSSVNLCIWLHGTSTYAQSFWFENHWGHRIIIILWSWKELTDATLGSDFGCRQACLYRFRPRGSWKPQVLNQKKKKKKSLKWPFFLSAQQTSLAEMQSIRMHEWRTRSDFSSQRVIVEILYKQLHFEITFFFHFYTQFVFYRMVHFLYDLFQRKREKKCPTVPLNKLTLGECENCTMDLKQFTYFCCVIIKLLKVCFLTFSVYSVCLCKCVWVGGWVWNNKPFLIKKECLFVSRSTVSIFCINVFYKCLPSRLTAQDPPFLCFLLLTLPPAYSLPQVVCVCVCVQCMRVLFLTWI